MSHHHETMKRLAFHDGNSEELATATPSQAFIRDCKALQIAIDELQDDLDPHDRDATEEIMAAPDNPSLFKMQFHADGVRSRRKSR